MAKKSHTQIFGIFHSSRPTPSQKNEKTVNFYDLCAPSMIFLLICLAKIGECGMISMYSFEDHAYNIGLGDKITFIVKRGNNTLNCIVTITEVM